MVGPNDASGAGVDNPGGYATGMWCFHPGFVGMFFAIMLKRSESARGARSRDDQGGEDRHDDGSCITRRRHAPMNAPPCCSQRRPSRCDCVGLQRENSLVVTDEPSRAIGLACQAAAVNLGNGVSP